MRFRLNGPPNALEIRIFPIRVPVSLSDGSGEIHLDGQAIMVKPSFLCTFLKLSGATAASIVVSMLFHELALS
jgi:hypothetical protein